MKIKLFLLLILTCTIFSGCKKDAKLDNKTQIVGKWYWVEQTYDSYTNNNLTGHQDYTTTLDPLSYFEFDIDGTFVENPQDRNGNFNYGKYRIEGNILYIKRNIDDEEWHYTIKTLSTSRLVIHRTSGESPYRGETEYSMKR